MTEREKMAQNVNAINDWCKAYFKSTGLDYDVFIGKAVSSCCGEKHSTAINEDGITIAYGGYSPVWFTVRNDGTFEDLLYYLHSDLCYSLVLNWETIKADIIKACDDVIAKKKAIFDFEV